MALVIKRMVNAYRYAIVDASDKRLDDFPFIRSPIPTVVLVIAYLVFVLKVGPEFMKNRKPFVLKKTLIFYNALQMIVCFLTAVLAAPDIKFNKWYCNPALPPHLDPPMYKYAGYVYFVMKQVDLLDTVFFVLKKNDRQITVLHLYHHTILAFCSWWFVKYYPTGHTTFIPYINMVVHTIMYGYYLLTAIDPSYKKNLWWKKHITQLQLIQFAVCFILYGAPLLNDCPYPKYLLLVLTFLNMIMTTLFANFYYQNYIKKKSAL